MTKVAKVAVIGAGPAGMFAAQRLHTAGIDVVVFEAGEDLDTRKCPDQHCPTCINRTRCAILCGLGGAGGYSDGKVTLSINRGTQVGDADLSTYRSYVTQVYDIFDYYNDRYTMIQPTERPEILKGSKFEFESYPLMFYGTEEIRNAFSIMKLVLEKSGVIFKFNTPVKNVLPFKSKVLILTSNSWEEFDYAIVATGSFNKLWMERLARTLDVKLGTLGPAEIGIRLETHNTVLEPLINEFYDFKIYYTATNGYTYRSFCVNRGGSIVNEHRYRDGLISINGRSEQPMTNRSNMAIIAKIPNSKKLVRSIAEEAFQDGGLPRAFYYQDFIGGSAPKAINLDLGRRNFLLENSREASLLPEQIETGFVEFLLELQKVLPDLAVREDSIVYMPEIKYHMPRWLLEDGFVVSGQPRVQIVGNAAGYTDSISTAAIMGLVAADLRAEDPNVHTRW